MSTGRPTIAKWIRTTTRTPHEFDVTQQRWEDIAGWSGLVGQSGGWSRAGDGRAVVVGLWADRAAHDGFFASDAHDDVAAQQRGTFHAIEIDFLDVEAQAGEHGEPGVDGVLHTVAHRTRPGRFSHVLGVRRDEWFPALRDAGMERGLLGVVAPAAPDEPGLVVALTWWRTRDDHERFAALPGGTDVAADCTSVQDDVADLEPKWTVAGERTA